MRALTPDCTWSGYVAGCLLVTHRSRLAAVLVDVPAADRARAVTFWAEAFGRPGRPGTEFPEYHVFGQVTPGVIGMVQGTGDAGPRVHFDIESDDVDAEVARLVALGATEVERIKTWVVMRDPAPVNYFASKYSFPHAAATMVVRGHAGFSALDDSALADPRIAALRP